MPDNAVTSLYDEDFVGLQSLVRSFDPPYGLPEIIAFNQLYGSIYPRLTNAERRRTEALVDDLIERLEDKNLASRIYGVV